MNTETKEKPLPEGVQAATDVEVTKPENNLEALQSEEPVAAPVAEEEAEPTLLEEAEARAKESEQHLLRVYADLENLKRRHQKELEGAHKFANEKLIIALLPVLDSMDTALKTIADKVAAEVQGFREGSELTLELFLKVLRDAGVAVIDPQGEPFNPELHQAISMVETDDVAADSVSQVVQKGYQLNGRLVRPAMVMVAKAPAEGSA